MEEEEEEKKKVENNSWNIIIVNSKIENPTMAVVQHITINHEKWNNT